jgi:hypothetical protein
MKKTLLLFTIFFTFTLVQSQSFSYKFGAAFFNTGGVFISLNGNINLDDSVLTISTIDKNNVESKATYSLVKQTNNIFYFTDGVKTYSFVTMSKSGKKKGFEYDSLVVWAWILQESNSVMYYCKKQ